MANESLPIDAVIPEILENLASSGAIVLKADPGAGKTTRVAPAILDVGLAKLPNGKPGKIILLQPRRVAARMAAVRMSEERGTTLGDDIGYQVRHEGRWNEKTRILVCTEGLFLRRLQDDPLLEGVSVVIFDEFHERSIDSDLSLALCRQVRREVRPDLRIVVMSATLDAAPIAQYLGNCPAMESPGRTYPIDIEYLQFPSNSRLPELAAEGINKILPRTERHVLTFLPGVGEIRQTKEILESQNQHEFLVLPLYGDMSLEEQQSVLRPAKERKVILATNVAETSLTIDGVTAVVDTGMARVNRFHSQLGLNRLELEKISKASADQRAGRAGRTAPGQCLRLWTEREHIAMLPFDAPEIGRVELSQCLLQLISWGEADIRNFEWFESPPQLAIDHALSLLHLLDVLDENKLTDLGKQVSQLPIQPRLARLILEGEKFQQGYRAAICAALLSEKDPFRRQEQRFVSNHRTSSDVLDRVSALEQFERTGERNSVSGMIAPGAAKTIFKNARQLAPKRDSSPPSDKGSAGNSDEALLRAICAAFPDRICKRRSLKDRRGVMVGGRGVRIAEESAIEDCDLFAAVELNDSGKSETLVRQASYVNRKWLPQAHISTSVDISYDVQKKKTAALKRVRYADLVLEEMQTKLPPDVDAAAILAEGIRTHLDIDALVEEEPRRYHARLQCLQEWLPELGLPDLSESPWSDLLTDWCSGCTSVSDLKQETLMACLRARLTPEQIAAVEKEAPDRMKVLGGRLVQIEYQPGKPPVLAARIQELYGVKETPRLAQGRQPLLMHLLAPNYKVQQITPDLASFWENTYPKVKQEMMRRYPKHAWPDNPLVKPPNPPQQERKKKLNL